MDFNELRIKEGKYWDVFLHADQTVLGRIYLWYKDEHTIDLLDVPGKAFDELYDTAKQIRNALTTLWKPNLFNYLVLGNNTHHLHFHIIPRYEKPVEVFGLVFKDDSFGKSYKRNQDFIVDKDTLIQITNELRLKL